MKKYVLFIVVLSLFFGCNRYYTNNIHKYKSDNYPHKPTFYFKKNQDTVRLVLDGDFRLDYKVAKRIEKDFDKKVIYFKNRDMRKILRRNKIGAPDEQFLFFFTSDYVALNGLGFYYDKPFPEEKLKSSKGIDSISVREDGNVISLFYPYKDQYVVDNFVPMKQGFSRVILLDKPGYDQHQTEGLLFEIKGFINDNFRDSKFKMESYLPY